MSIREQAIQMGVIRPNVGPGEDDPTPQRWLKEGEVLHRAHWWPSRHTHILVSEFVIPPTLRMA